MSIFGPLEPLVQTASRRSAQRTAEAILNVQNQTPHGIDFKNPFTMSNTGRLDPITVLSHGEPFLFIIWIFAGARRNSISYFAEAKNGRPSIARVDDMGFARVASRARPSR